MTKQDNLPNEDLVLLGDKLRDAWHKPCNDETRTVMVNAMLCLSIEDRGFVACWASLGKPGTEPPASDPATKARREAYVAAVAQSPELILSLDPPFFSPRHCTAGERHLTIRGPSSTGPGTLRWPRKPKAESGRAALA